MKSTVRLNTENIWEIGKFGKNKMQIYFMIFSVFETAILLIYSSIFKYIIDKLFYEFPYDTIFSIFHNYFM